MLALFVFKRDQNGSNRSHRGKVGWNDQFSIGDFQNVPKGFSHSKIGGHSSLKDDRSWEVLSLPHVTLKISRHRVTEACDDIIIGCGDLLKVDHIRFGKDTAS